jgi:hypothetical protein
MSLRRHAIIALAILLVALLAAPFNARAHGCNPLDSGPTEIGTPLRTVTTSAGTADVYWCQYTGPLTPPGMVTWRATAEINLNTCKDPARVLAAAGRVIAAGTNAMRQFETELRAAAADCIVTPGTQNAYEAQRLRYLGCLELANNPPPNTPPDWLKPAGAPSTWKPADWCGAPPVPPAPPPPVTGTYVVTGTQAFPLRADGTRSITAWPVPPIKGEAADAAVQVIQYGVRFCKVPRLSTAQVTVVAGCSAK